MAEYLRDDLAYDVWGMPALSIGPEGLDVRVRPGTTGIPEHLYGCPIRVAYVDPTPPARPRPNWTAPPSSARATACGTGCACTTSLIEHSRWRPTASC